LRTAEGRALLADILDAAITATGADFGNIQLVSPLSGALEIVAQKGFEPDFLDHFRVTHVGQAACGTAMRERARVVVEDVESHPAFRDTRLGAVMRAAGVRAVQSTPLIDRNGTLFGVLSTHFRNVHRSSDYELHLVDVFARLLTEIDAKRVDVPLRGLLNAAPDPILAVDAAGRIVFANTHAEQTFGYAHNELLEQPVELLVPDRVRDRHRALRTSYLSAPTTRAMGAGLELRARRKDGTELPVEISLSPLGDPGGSMTVVIIRDVSDRTRLEEERATERAAVAQLKDDLSNMIIHDLKNPVNGIIMTTQAMLRRAHEVSDRQRKGLNNIEQTCHEMLRLTHNLLDIAKMEAGKMPVQEEAVDLARIVADVARAYGPVAEQLRKRLVTAVGGPLPSATADADLVRRVLVNLVVNAIRHSGGDQVCIEAQAESANATLTMRVVDNGRGIALADQARIFEKFASVRRSPSGEPSGDTGLGLPFCKLAVERMGGAIALASRPGASTVFSVTLPVHGAVRAATPGASTDHGEPSRG
jgi:PAS domain S-box-containing protein